MNPQEIHPERIKKSDRSLINKLDYSNVEFPVKVTSFNKIEKQNSIRINVFGYENKQAYPMYVSKERFDDHLNLLLITNEDKQHYLLIKDFDRFMYNQTKHEHRKHSCMYCLQCLSSEDLLSKHKTECIVINGEQAIKMPEKGEKIKFQNHSPQLQAPFVIYADFEAVTEKVDSCKPNDNDSYTEAYQKHTDCGFSYKVVCCYDDKYSKPAQIYRGENAVCKFMEKIIDEVKYCRNTIKYKFNKPIKMTPADEETFKQATECHICGKKYNNKDKRVRDHCHVTGKYRGSAHEACNLNFQLTDKIPVIFHNLRGYDSHFITQQIGQIAKNNTYTNKKGEEQEMKINCIPNSMEKYMAFMLGHNLVFIDSFQFMSLDKLVDNLPKESLKYTSEVFQGKALELMSKKGVYPYDYMDSFEKFNETKLPTKD